MTRTAYQTQSIAALQRIEDLTITGTKVAVALWAIVLVWIWVFHLGAQRGWLPGVAGYLLGFAAIFFGVFWRSFLWKPVSQQYNLICSDCGASLLKSGMVTVSVMEVLKSGKCQKCGATVLDGDMPPPRPLTLRRLRRVPALFWWVLAIAFYFSVRQVNSDFCTSRYAAARSADDTANVNGLAIPLDFSRGTHHATCKRQSVTAPGRTRTP